MRKSLAKFYIDNDPSVNVIPTKNEMTSKVHK